MRNTIPVCLLVAATATLFSASSQQPESTNAPRQPESTSPKKTQLLSSRKEPPMPMPLVAPLFIENGTIHSTITLVNNFSKSLDVDVVLSGLEGNQVAKSTITMGAYSQNKVGLANILRHAPWAAPSGYGSVLLNPHTASPLAAQLSVVNELQQNDMEEEFMMMMGSAPANYRAVAGNLSTMPIVAIRSTSATQEMISITCLSENGRLDSTNLKITPNQTLLVRGCRANGPTVIADLDDNFASAPDWKRDSKKAGGIAVSSSAPAMNLAVFGIAVHGEGAQRLLSGIPFWAVDMLKSATAIYPGVPAAQDLAFGGQSFQLRASVVNFSTTPRKATLLLSTGSGKDSAQKAIATITIPAQSVSTADLPELPSGAAVFNSIVVQTDGNPGEVLSNIQAIMDDKAARFDFALPWKDQQQFDNAGEHPWIIGDSDVATVLLYNPDSALTNDFVQLTIRAGQATWTKQISIAPLATVAISLNDIVKKQEPDVKGQKLPSDSSEGIVTWYTYKNPRIFGKLVQLDELAGIPRNYACSYGQVICGVEVPDTYIQAGQQGTIYFSTDGCPSVDYGCGCGDDCTLGGPGGISQELWTSSDSNIASPVDQWGNWQGNNIGGTSLYVNVADFNHCWGGGPGYVNVVPAPCFAQLKYRTVGHIGGVSVGNHSFWWIQQVIGSAWPHFVIDGGPSGSPCPGDCGNLTDWFPSGDIGYYSQDNPNAGTWYDTGLHADICGQVSQLYLYATSWDDNRYQYYLFGPNSNTFAHYAGWFAGFYPSAPPDSPGWDTVLP